MKVEFRRSFSRDLKKIRETNLRKRIQLVIEQIEQAHSLNEIENVKKLRGGDDYYRIRIGQYRLGIKLEQEKIIFIRCLHRREIYRHFP